MRDIENRKDVELLIDEFYKKVLKDEVINHFFTKVVKLEWEVHIPIMVDFWDSMLFGSGQYKGNPMIKHVELSRKSSLEQAHFDQWLQLWKETIRSLFKGIKSEEAIDRAHSIAGLMFHKINQAK